MAVDGAKAGLVAVMAELRPDGGVDEPVEQLDLLGLRQVSVANPVVHGSGRGRPAGSKNRRTAEWADYIARRYGDPREVLAQMMSAPVEELMTQLECSRMEAWQEKRHAAVALLPFVASRMPISVDVTNRKVVHLTIVEGEAEGDDGLGADIVEVLGYQEVSREADGAVEQSEVERDA